MHICYCYNPFRYVGTSATAPWRSAATAGPGRAGRLSRRWREWDWIAAQRVDHYVTISKIDQAPDPQLLRA